MSNVGLFLIGTLVTLLVTASMALLIWGAVLDGRHDREQREAEREAAERRSKQKALRAVDAA